MLNYKEYYQKNKERIKKIRKEYIKNHKIAIAQRCKEYRERNKEKLIKLSSNYYLKHRDVLLARQKIYTKNNKEKIKKYRQKIKYTFNHKYTQLKSLAKRRKIDWDLTKKQFAIFWKKSCVYCGEEIIAIGLDRVDNKKGYIYGNVVPCCTMCNTWKSNLTLRNFLKKAKIIANLNFDTLKKEIQANIKDI